MTQTEHQGPSANTDLLVLGGGPGGYVAAIRAAQLGAKVTLVEQARLGGTCLNVGCIPTKALVKSAELYEQTQKLEKYGIIVGPAQLDFPRMMARKDSVVQNLVRGVESLVRANGIRLITGTATLLGPGQVKVQTTDAQELTLQPDKIIIATGSLPAAIPGIEVDGVSVLTSTEALSLPALPQNMLLIGGGVIGVELTGIFARLGVQVSIVEALPAVLPGEDGELAALVHQGLEKLGVKIWTGGQVKKVTTSGAGVEVDFEVAGSPQLASAEKVVVCVGRRPNTLGVDVERLGLAKPGGRGIQVNRRMETALPGVYAVGDVTGEYQLAHVASEQGVVAAENALGLNAHMNYQAVPRCIFSVPEVGAVGLTEEAALREYGDKAVVGRFPMAANGKALANGATEGLVKVIAQRDSLEILGVGIAGAGAAELVAEASLAISAELTLEEVIAAIHAHPTVAETVKEAVLAAAGRAIHIKNTNR